MYIFPIYPSQICRHSYFNSVMRNWKGILNRVCQTEYICQKIRENCGSFLSQRWGIFWFLINQHDDYMHENKVHVEIIHVQKGNILGTTCVPSTSLCVFSWSSTGSTIHKMWHWPQHPDLHYITFWRSSYCLCLQLFYIPMHPSQAKPWVLYLHVYHYQLLHIYNPQRCKRSYWL